MLSSLDSNCSRSALEFTEYAAHDSVTLPETTKKKLLVLPSASLNFTFPSKETSIPDTLFRLETTNLIEIPRSWLD